MKLPELRYIVFLNIAISDKAFLMASWVSILSMIYRKLTSGNHFASSEICISNYDNNHYVPQRETTIQARKQTMNSKIYDATFFKVM